MSQSFCFGTPSVNRNNNTNNAGSNNQVSLSMAAWGGPSSTQQTQNNNLNFAFPPSSNQNMNVQQQQQTQPQQHGVNPLSVMSHLQSQYDARSAQCRFECVLYNKIPANMSAAAFDKPPLIRTAVWEQGLANNPSANKLVPVAVRGYDEMRQRSNLCLAGHCSAIKRFEELSQRIAALKHQIDAKTKQTITDLKQTQLFLSQRLLAVLRAFVCQSQTENQNPNLKTPISQNELKLKKALDRMARESNELLSRFAHVKRVASRMDSDRKGFVVQSDAEHLSAEAMQQMFAFLKQQQNFVHLLAKTVQTDIKHLDVVRHGMPTQIQNKAQRQRQHFGGGAAVARNRNRRNVSALF